MALVILNRNGRYKNMSCTLKVFNIENFPPSRLYICLIETAKTSVPNIGTDFFSSSKLLDLVVI